MHCSLVSAVSLCLKCMFRYTDSTSVWGRLCHYNDDNDDDDDGDFLL